MSLTKWLLALAVVSSACGSSAKKTAGPEAGDAPEAPAGSAEAAGGTAPAETGPAEPPPSRDPVKVAVGAPTVGEVAQVVETVEQDGTMLVGTREVKMARKTEVRRREEVAAVDGNRASKLKVAYETVTDHRTTGTVEQDVASPFAGKTFTVGVTGAKLTLTVAGGDGKAIKGKLKDLLGLEFRDDVVAPWRGAAVLAERTFNAGEAVTVPAKDLIALLPEGRDDIKGDTMTVTFVERRGDVATFDIAGTVTRPEGKLTLTLTLKGTLKVDVVKGRPVEIQVSADAKGAGGGADYTGTVKGTKTFAAP